MKKIRRCSSAALAVLFICLGCMQALAAPEQVEKAIEIAVAIAEDDTHGYGDYEREGNPDYDCSSFVCTAFSQAGFDVYPLNNVGSMIADFTEDGFFYIADIDFTTPKDEHLALLLRGDILLKDGHTELYIGDRMMVGAHLDYDGEPGDSQGNEINVRSYYARGYDGSVWEGVLRYYETLPPLGDADLDGELSAADARYALRAAVGLENVSENTLRFAAADADKNGRIESADARLILRAAVGLETLEGDITLSSQPEKNDAA